jgi:hypothetical protein
LTKLRERKRALQIESDLNRQVLVLEYEQLRLRTSRLKSGAGQFLLSWKWLAPVAGFLLARKFKRVGGFFSGGSLGWLLLRQLWQFVQNAPQKSAEEGGDRNGQP